MANDHDEWLKEQGAKVCGRRPLYHSVIDPVLSYQYSATELNEISFRTQQLDQVYQIEVRGSTVKRWRQYADRLQHIIDDADRYGKTPVGIQVEQRQRHEQLLAENPMYQQAWQEFQQIRALLGEDPYWP